MAVFIVSRGESTRPPATGHAPNPSSPKIGPRRHNSWLSILTTAKKAFAATRMFLEFFPGATHAFAQKGDAALENFLFFQNSHSRGAKATSLNSSMVRSARFGAQRRLPRPS